MRNSTIISLGTCARLSMLDNVEELRALIKSKAVDAELRVSFDDRESIGAFKSHISLEESALLSIRQNVESQLFSYLRSLISEFIATLEATVLCDEIMFLRGFRPEVREQFWSKMDDPFSIPMETFWGWDLFHSDREKTFDLANLIFEEFDAKPVGINDYSLLEVELMLYSQQFLGAPLSDFFASFKADGIDVSYMKELIGINEYLDDVDETRKNRREYFREGYKQFELNVDKFLGQDWLAFKSHIFSVPMPDAGLMKQDFYYLRDTYDLQKLAYRIAHYSELRAATELSSTLISSLADSGYYSNFIGQDQCRSFELRKICSTHYSLQIERHLNNYGLTDISLKIPPVARMCLRDANSVFGAIQNASQLRKTGWATSLRRHLTELCNQRDAIKTLKSMRRLHNLIDTKIERLGKLSIGGIGFSSTGAVSLSISGISQRLLEWRNPALLINTNWINDLQNQDSILDIARITGQSRTTIRAVLK
jgi:hypothetical protein